MESVWHRQHLLHRCESIVPTTVWVSLTYSIVWTIRPIYGIKNAYLSSTIANLKGEKTIGVSANTMKF